jgi:hypothetical protein
MPALAVTLGHRAWATLVPAIYAPDVLAWRDG